MPIATVSFCGKTELFLSRILDLLTSLVLLGYNKKLSKFFAQQKKRFGNIGMTNKLQFTFTVVYKTYKNDLKVGEFLNSTYRIGQTIKPATHRSDHVRSVLRFRSDTKFPTLSQICNEPKTRICYRMNNRSKKRPEGLKSALQLVTFQSYRYFIRIRSSAIRMWPNFCRRSTMLYSLSASFFLVFTARYFQQQQYLLYWKSFSSSAVQILQSIFELCNLVSKFQVLCVVACEYIQRKSVHSMGMSIRSNSLLI